MLKGDIIDLDERVEHRMLSRVDEVLICAWLQVLGVEPNRTPVWAEIDYDPVYDEWRIEQIWMSRDGKLDVLEDGSLRTFFIRRRRVPGGADLPWPTWRQKFDELWDQVTDPNEAGVNT